VPRRDIDFLSPVTTDSTVACVEAGGTIKVFLELVELDVVIPSSANTECGLNVGELGTNTEERTFSLCTECSSVLCKRNNASLGVE
jgi:hypothetical protein